MTDTLVGERLGNYEIQTPLGRGGMAHVYKAMDLTLRRLVAIKVIEPTLSVQERYRDRFEREAQAVASLEHSNIVPIYYFGKTEKLYYLVMKFIEGEDLGTIMNRYAIAGEYLPVADVLRIVEGVSSGLDYAHRKGVVHRDVKPANIMIDRDGHPYLTDFGLALNLGQGSIGDVLGTPHYVAPEQAKNSAEAVPQSDIYALGVVLYELFTSVVPFDDPSPTAVALQHVMNEPPAPRSLNPEIQPKLEAVILKAMAKDSAQRYQNGQELMTELRTALQNVGKPRDQLEIPALPPLPPGMLPPPARRPSMRPVSAEVQASLAQRSAIETALNAQAPLTASARTAVKVTAKHTSAATTLPANDSQPASSYLPLVVLGGVVIAVLVIVGIVALSLNNNPSNVALIPTQTIIEPTATVPPATNTEAPTEITQATVLPTSIPASDTPHPPTATDVLPTATTIPPISTTVPSPIPPTFTPVVVQAALSPTSAPADWLPVRFIYDANAFYWMNDSTQPISSAPIVFERVGGTEHFEGNRFAYYSMESGRCMQIMFVDVAVNGCPEGRRPNAFFTPSQTQGVDFWTGATGQFRVLWNGVEITVCEISAGLCNAFIPPN
jgi:serine/threonine protein kinase